MAVMWFGPRGGSNLGGSLSKTDGLVCEDAMVGQCDNVGSCSWHGLRNGPEGTEGFDLAPSFASANSSQKVPDEEKGKRPKAEGRVVCYLCSVPGHENLPLLSSSGTKSDEEHPSTTVT